MSKHTPGPWKASRSFGENKTARFLVSAIDSNKTLENGYFAACVAVCDIEANARLIAAAPELLEALKILLEEFKRVQTIGLCQTHAKGLAIDALAKAEGR